MTSLFVNIWLYSAVVFTTYGQRYYDCQDIYDAGYLWNRVYKIWPFLSSVPIDVSCDINTGTGNVWTVIHRRINGEENFHRKWEEYKVGFGDVRGEHWLGNDNIHYLTTANGEPGKRYMLRIELTDWYGNAAYAEYSGFRISQSFDKFNLILDQFLGGPAGDSLSELNGNPFSTYDDENSGYEFSGGWWFTASSSSNLNGDYIPLSSKKHGTLTENGILWKTWRGSSVSYQAVTMKIRQE
ncbi:ficolin-2-like [Glandiceps talaboti]